MTPFTITRLAATPQYPIDTSGSDWAASDRSIPYMETVSAQPIICEMGRGPLTMGQKKYRQCFELRVP